jgi:HEAT repeat protein
MQPDSATRILLALILLCLVILIVQGFSGAGDPLERGWARYSVIGMRAGSPLLIRTDGATGQVWKLELRGGDRWVAFQEPDDAQSHPTRRESSTEPAEPGDAEVEVVEPPGAPRLPSEAPRAAAEVPEVLPPPGTSSSLADVPDFAKALANEALPSEMRVWVAGELASVDDPSSTEALVQALGTPDVEVVLAILQALEGREDPRVRSAAEKALTHADPRVRSAAQRVFDPLY